MGNTLFSGYNGKLKPYAQKLRKNATPQENHLWYDFLRAYPVQFYRQRIVAERFIADFYCARARLVLELDGSQHFTVDGQQYDTLRTEVIEQYRLNVLRFTNADIDGNFPGVCRLIDCTVKKYLDESALCKEAPC